MTRAWRSEDACIQFGLIGAGRLLFSQSGPRRRRTFSRDLLPAHKNDYDRDVVSNDVAQEKSL